MKLIRDSIAFISLATAATTGALSAQDIEITGFTVVTTAPACTPPGACFNHHPFEEICYAHHAYDEVGSPLQVDLVSETELEAILGWDEACTNEIRIKGVLKVNAPKVKVRVTTWLFGELGVDLTPLGLGSNSAQVQSGVVISAAGSITDGCSLSSASTTTETRHVTSVKDKEFCLTQGEYEVQIFLRTTVWVNPSPLGALRARSSFPDDGGQGFHVFFTDIGGCGGEIPGLPPLGLALMVGAFALGGFFVLTRK